jgi:hypothetical protein
MNLPLLIFLVTIIYGLNYNYCLCYRFNNNINNKHFILKETKQETKQETNQVSTVTIFFNKPDTKVLVCLRGVCGKSYGKIYSIGGSIESNETPEDSAIRETFEESGINIKESDLQLVNTMYTKNKVYYNYVVFYDKMPTIKGPQKDFEGEVINCCSILNTNTITCEGINTRWAAINIDTLNYYFSVGKETSLFSEVYIKYLHNIAKKF